MTPPSGILSPTSVGYTARVLPEAEWDRLPDEVRRALAADWALVVVVEDAAGTIVGRWCVLNTIHLEGLFIAPHARKNPVVAGALFSTMVTTLREAGVTSVLTLTEEPTVRTLAEHVGFVPIPGAVYRLDL